MDEPALFPWLLAGLATLGLGVFGLRGLLELREALRTADLAALDPPANWPLTRAFLGLCASLPVLAVTTGWSSAGSRLLAALGVAALGYAVAPQFLASARRRVAQEVIDDLPVHLDLLAVAVEAGGSLTGALTLCVERAPEGALRRAFERVLPDISAGAEPAEALRTLEQRVALRPVTTFVTAVRAAEKGGVPLALVLRDRARHCAANRYARAERLARIAPLKLWATLLLCLAPCTLVVLAFPVAQLLALVLE